jgi:hypothetical protein
MRTQMEVYTSVDHLDAAGSLTLYLNAYRSLLTYKLKSRRMSKIDNGPEQIDSAYWQIQETKMKKIFFVLALLIMGGFSLSAASTAGAVPALKSIGDVAETQGDVQLAHLWWKKRHHDDYGYDRQYYYKPQYYKHGYYGGHHYQKHYKGYRGDDKRFCYKYDWKGGCEKDFNGDN